MKTSKILKGRDLMIFLHQQSIAFATNHTFSFTANLVEVSTKDGGVYAQNAVFYTEEEKHKSSLVFQSNGQITINNDITLKKGQKLVIINPSSGWFVFGTSINDNNDVQYVAEENETIQKSQLQYNGGQITNGTDVTYYIYTPVSEASLQNMTWEMTSENLYTVQSYDELLDYMINATELELYFGMADAVQTNIEGLDLNNPYGEAWGMDTIDGTPYYTGKAIITSLTANANNGENATYSVTFTGLGSCSYYSHSEKQTSFDDLDEDLENESEAKATSLDDDTDDSSTVNVQFNTGVDDSSMNVG